jgi:polyphosphate kinase
LALVEREAQHARDGAPSGIRLKINGLSDAELIDALYRASNAGVDIELIVRGVCRLRPGVPGMSERIRVLSILGRYLEHGRIYRFVNRGDPEYYIGSADWRPRNVRRRVETVASVLDPACRAKLDLILDRELADSSAWELMSNGGYHRATNASTDPGSASQTMFAAEAQLDAPAAPTPA